MPQEKTRVRYSNRKKGHGPVNKLMGESRIKRWLEQKQGENLRNKSKCRETELWLLSTTPQRHVGTAPVTLSLGNTWRWMTSFIPWQLYLWRKNHHTNWTGLVGPRFIMDSYEKRNTFCKNWQQNNSSIVQLVS
jgi:hypothetical protein